MGFAVAALEGGNPAASISADTPLFIRNSRNTSDAAMTGPSHHVRMTAIELGLYLRRIRFTRSAPVLHAIAAEVERQFPSDEATPRVVAMCYR